MFGKQDFQLKMLGKQDFQLKMALNESFKLRVFRGTDYQSWLDVVRLATHNSDYSISSHIDAWVPAGVINWGVKRELAKQKYSRRIIF